MPDFPPDEIWGAEHLHATPTPQTTLSSVHGAMGGQRDGIDEKDGAA